MAILMLTVLLGAIEKMRNTVGLWKRSMVVSTLLTFWPARYLCMRIHRGVYFVLQGIERLVT